MSADIHSGTPAPEPVQVTLDPPGRIVEHYDIPTRAGICLSLPEAIRLAVISSWRFETGSFHSLRPDLATGDETPAEDSSTDRAATAED